MPIHGFWRVQEAKPIEERLNDVLEYNYWILEEDEKAKSLLAELKALVSKMEQEIRSYRLIRDQSDYADF